MDLDGVAPAVGYVTTRKAAAMWGCHTTHLIGTMRAHGVAPLVTMHSFGGRTYWWNPETVLRVRAEHKLKVLQSHAVQAQARRARPVSLASRLLAKHTMLERRRKILIARYEAKQLLQRGTP